jgi:hypothetical protein
MTDHPDWDYWLYENLGNGKYRDIASYALNDGDIRSDKYDLDFSKWCRKYFWTAQEAALISFFRDPDKVERTDADFIFHDEVYAPGDDDEHGKKNIELRQYITDLYDLIEDAQTKKVLPAQFFLPEMYIDWARRVGVDIPQSVSQELALVESERNQEKTPAQSGDETKSADADSAPKRKSNSQKKRLENNLTKILLAVLVESKLIDKEPTALSKKLELILENMAHEQGDKHLSLGAPTIEDRLAEARELLK